MPGTERIDSIYDLASLEREQQTVIEGLAASRKAIIDLYNSIQQFKGSNIGNLAENTDKLTEATLRANKATQAALDTAIKQERLKQQQIKTEQLQQQAIDKTTAALEKKKQAEQSSNIPFTSNLNSDGSLQEPAQGLTTGAIVNESDKKDVQDIADATAYYNEQAKNIPQTNASAAQSFEELSTASSEYVGSINQNIAALIEDQTALASNKAAQKQLNAEIAANGGATAEQTQQLIKLTTEQFQLNESIAQTRATVKNLTKEFLSEEGSVVELRAQVSNLTATYEKLSSVEKQQTFGIQTKAQIDKLQPALVEAEAALGNNQRKVGSYSSAITGAFKGAFGYLRQLANILPGIGLAGLFGLAFDAVQKLIDSIASGSSKIDTFAANFKNLNDVVAEADKKAGSQIATLKILYQASTDVANSDEERRKAAVALQQTYPETFKNFNIEEIELGKAKKGYDDLTQSIIAQAKAQAAKGKIDEIEAQRLDILFQKQKIINATNAESARAAKLGATTVNVSGGTAGLGTTVGITAEDNRRQALASISERRNKALQEQEVKDNSLAQQEKFLIAFVGEKNITNVVEKETEKRAAAAKKVKPDTTLEDAVKQQFQSLIQFGDAQQQSSLDKLQQIGNDENALTSLRILALKKYEELKSGLINEDADNEIAVNQSTAAQQLVIKQKASNDIQKLESDTQAKILKIQQDAAKKQADLQAQQTEQTENNIIQLGDSTLAKLQANREQDLKDEKAKADAKKEIQKQLYEEEKKLADSAFTFIQTLADASFERRINQYQTQLDASNAYYSQEIQNVNNSSLNDQQKSDKTIQLQAQQNAKQLQLQQQINIQKEREAKADRDADILRIVGEAIVRQFEIPLVLGGPFGPLGIAIDIGAALQIATLLAKPLPKYADGLAGNKPTHIGIYGEAGAELIEKPGKSPFISDTPTVDILPAGTRIKPLTGDTVNQIMQHQLLKSMAMVSSKDSDEGIELQRKMLKALRKKPVINNHISLDMNKAVWKYLNITRG